MVKTKDVLVWGGVAVAGLVLLRSLGSNSSADPIGGGSPAVTVVSPPVDMAGIISSVLGSLPAAPAAPAAPAFDFSGLIAALLAPVVPVAPFIAPFVPQAVDLFRASNGGFYNSQGVRIAPTSNQNLLSETLSTQQLAQVAAAVGSGAAVAQELVTAYETQTGLSLSAESSESNSSGLLESVTDNFLALRGAVTTRTETTRAAATEAAETLTRRLNPSDLVDRTKLRGDLVLPQRIFDGRFPGLNLDETELNRILDDARRNVGQGLEFPGFPEFPAFPDPVGDAKKEISESVRGAGREVERAASGIKVGLEVVGTGTLAAQRIPKIGPRVIRPAVRTVPGLSGTSNFMKLLIPVDIGATIYEIFSGRDLPVLGYSELFRNFGILPRRETDAPVQGFTFGEDGKIKIQERTTA